MDYAADHAVVIEARSAVALWQVGFDALKSGFAESLVIRHLQGLLQRLDYGGPRGRTRSFATGLSAGHGLNFESWIPPKSNRIARHQLRQGFYKMRGRIEIMFGRLEEWRRIAMRLRSLRSHVLLGICIAAVVIFWL